MQNWLAFISLILSYNNCTQRKLYTIQFRVSPFDRDASSVASEMYEIKDLLMLMKENTARLFVNRWGGGAVAGSSATKMIQAI